MSLSCTCREWDGDGWCWDSPEDFTTLATKTRCCSCKQSIEIGAQCVEFERFRATLTEVEDKIYGEDGDVRLASWWMCEPCGEIYLNLVAAGYCIDISENMPELLEEYHIMTGWKGFSPNHVLQGMPI